MFLEKNQEKNGSKINKGSFKLFHHPLILSTDFIYAQRFEKEPFGFCQGGIVIKPLMELKFIYYHRSGNKNICHGVCKFGIIDK